MKCVIFLILAVCYVNCQKQTLTVSDIEITWENKGNETEFVLKSELGNGVDLEHSWLGIGFGGQMNNVNSVICKNTPTEKTVEQYFMKDYKIVPLEKKDIGISRCNVYQRDKTVICKFSRSNINAQNIKNYYEITDETRTKLIAAYGSVDELGRIRFHSKKEVSKEFAEFSLKAVYYKPQSWKIPNIEIPSYKVPENIMNYKVPESILNYKLPENMMNYKLPENMMNYKIPEIYIANYKVPEYMLGYKKQKERKKNVPNYKIPEYMMNYKLPEYLIPEYKAPEYNIPEYKAPEYNIPEYKAPEYKAPEYNIPEYKAPEYNIPEYKSPEYNIPEYKAPVYNIPEYKAQEYNIPEYKAPEYNMPEYKAPEYNIPEYKAPEYNIPEYKAPEYNIPEYKAPEYNIPEYKAPEYNIPEYKAPEYNIPEYKAPEYNIPEYKAPEFNIPNYKVPAYISSYMVPVKLAKAKRSEKNQDYKVPEIPSYKAPEIPSYNIPENLLNYKNPSYSDNQISPNILTQSLMAMFFNIITNYQTAIPIENESSQQYASSFDPASISLIENILNNFADLKIPEKLTVQNALNLATNILENFKGPYPDMSDSAFTKNGLLDYATSLINQYKPQELPEVSSYMVNKMPVKDVMGMLMGFLSLLELPVDTSETKVSNNLLNIAADLLNRYKSPGMPSLSGNNLGKMQVKLILEQMLNIIQSFRKSTKAFKVNTVDTMDLSNLFSKLNMPFGNMIEVMMGIMSNLKSPVFTYELDALDINKRVEYFENIAKVQDYLSMNYEPANLASYLTRIDPVMLNNLVGIPQVMKIASFLVSMLN